MIEQDFGFRGILTANELSEFRENRPGRRGAGTIQDEPGTHLPGAVAGSSTRLPAGAGAADRRGYQMPQNRP